MTKSAVSKRNLLKKSHLLKKSLTENFIFCAVLSDIYDGAFLGNVLMTQISIMSDVLKTPLIWKFMICIWVKIYHYVNHHILKIFTLCTLFLLSLNLCALLRGSSKIMWKFYLFECLSCFYLHSCENCNLKIFWNAWGWKLWEVHLEAFFHKRAQS